MMITTTKTTTTTNTTTTFLGCDSIELNLVFFYSAYKEKILTDRSVLHYTGTGPFHFLLSSAEYGMGTPSRGASAASMLAIKYILFQLINL